MLILFLAIIAGAYATYTIHRLRARCARAEEEVDVLSKELEQAEAELTEASDSLRVSQKRLAAAKSELKSQSADMRDKLRKAESALSDEKANRASFVRNQTEEIQGRAHKAMAENEAMYRQVALLKEYLAQGMIQNRTLEGAEAAVAACLPTIN